MTTQANEANKRHFTRIPFDALLEVIPDNGKQFKTRLLDISLKGALIKRPTEWQAQPGEWHPSATCAVLLNKIPPMKICCTVNCQH